MVDFVYTKMFLKNNFQKVLTLYIQNDNINIVKDNNKFIKDG